MINNVKKRQKYNSNILESLMIKYDVSYEAVRLAINGKRKSIIAKDIKKDYLRLLSQLNKKIEKNKQA